MKTKSDPRHQKRIKLMQELFSWNFKKDSPINSDVRPIIENLEKIDKLIEESAPNRPLDEINKIDLSILRLSVFELIIVKGTPPKVVVDEAVELGKEYGSESTPSFINGALGKLIENEEIKI